MDPLVLVDLIIGLAQGAAAGFGKVGLANLAASVKAAADQLLAVRNDPVTKAEVEQYRLSPKW